MERRLVVHGVVPNNGVTVRCVDCLNRTGRDRTFRSMDGYKTHLRDYHEAKPTDAVKVVRAEEK